MARQGVKSSSVLAMKQRLRPRRRVAYEAAFKKAGVTLVSTSSSTPGSRTIAPCSPA